MKSRIFKLALIALAALMLFGSITVSAYDAYDTYTYSIDGISMKSPAAYTASVSMSSYDIGLVSDRFGGKPIAEAADIFSDVDGNIYIADRGREDKDPAKRVPGRIIVMNKYYAVTDIISEYVDEFGRQQSFAKPSGVYVTDPAKTSDGSSYIYVCDTGNSRIVVFDREYNYVRTISCPQSPLITAAQFVPIAVAVDIYGRIFVVSQGLDKGIIALSSDGDFTGYIGAQKVTYSVIESVWRRFQTDEQREAQQDPYTPPYNNITVDDDGFVYATSDFIDEQNQLGAIKSKSADYSPVKKLNSTGAQILKRNGFFDPGGEVDVFYASDVSKINDVALGAEGSWTILDYRHSKFFTYDQNGNLLFAFGDRGDQLGNGVELKGITYQVVDGVYYLLALDSTPWGYNFTVYSPTEYCDKIISALHNQNNHLYSASIDDWQEVLTRNNNFDLAYIGIGKALYSQGKYDEAQAALANAYETAYASKAFTEARKDVIGKWIIPVVIAAVVVIVLLVKFLGYAKKKNKATSLKVGKKSYLEELLFIFHLVFHPFDGFWDLKHEKRGSVRAASTFLVLTVLAFFYNSIGKGYLFNPRGTSMTIFMAILSVTLPVFLWAISNWCLTTLFDGEGSFKDIYIATCYSLAPLALMLTISTVLTNVLSSSEAMIVTLVTGIGIVWSLILVFFGMLVTHDYSLSKNLITTLGTIVAMLIIMFVAILFSSLLVKMVSFITGLVSEIVNRL